MDEQTSLNCSLDAPYEPIKFFLIQLPLVVLLNTEVIPYQTAQRFPAPRPGFSKILRLRIALKCFDLENHEDGRESKVAFDESVLTAA